MTERKPLFILISEGSSFEHLSCLCLALSSTTLACIVKNACKFLYHRPTCSKYATSSVLAWSLPCDAVIPQKNACFDLLTCSMMIWQWGKPLEFSSECQASFAVIVCNSNKIKKSTSGQNVPRESLSYRWTLSVFCDVQSQWRSRKKRICITSFFNKCFGSKAQL